MAIAHVYRFYLCGRMQVFGRTTNTIYTHELVPKLSNKRTYQREGTCSDPKRMRARSKTLQAANGNQYFQVPPGNYRGYLKNKGSGPLESILTPKMTALMYSIVRKTNIPKKNREHSVWAPCKAPNSAFYTARRLARRPAGIFFSVQYCTA